MRANRNLRIVLVVERRGEILIVDGASDLLPATHVLAGESLRAAAARLARALDLAIRVSNVVAIAERSGRLTRDRTIDVFLRTQLITEAVAGTWLGVEELERAGLDSELAAAIRSGRGAPYRGKIDEPAYAYPLSDVRERR